MPKRKYALEVGGPQRLELTWQGALSFYEKEITIKVDGELIGCIPTPERPVESRSFQLPDGSTLRVQIERYKLQIYKNDQPIEEIDYERTLRRFFWSIFLSFSLITFITIARILHRWYTSNIGVTSAFLAIEKAGNYEQIGDISLAITGVVIIVASFFIKRASIVPLVINSLAWFGNGIIWYIVLPLLQGQKWDYMGIIASLLVGLSIGVAHWPTMRKIRTQVVSRKSEYLKQTG